MCSLMSLVYGIRLNIVEVAHDIQLSVSKNITGSLNFVDSFDTWHGILLILQVDTYCSAFLPGTKNVDKQMRKVTQGRVRDRGVTWFPQLVDKSKYCLLIFRTCLLH